MTFLELAQTLQMAIKALQMYTAVHPRSQEALKALAAALADWHRERPELQIAASAGKVFVDGAPIEGTSLHVTALQRQLSERQIAGFVIQRGVPPEELLAMLELLILKPAKLEEAGGVARVLAAKGLRYISLSQTQYREVREGEGGEEDSGGAAVGREAGQGAGAEERPSAEPLAIDIAEALDLWQQHLAAATQGLTFTADDGFLGFVPAANLAGLGRPAEDAGWGPAFPTAPQMESLRQAVGALAGELQLSILKGMHSLPMNPAGLHMGFQALAPEVVSQASANLLARGIAWSDLKETLYELVSLSPQRQSLMAGLEAGLRGQGLSAGQLGDLLRQLDWDGQPLEEKIRRVLEERKLWELSLEQRLAFLRELLTQGRLEPFMRILERVLEGLKEEDPRPREAAARTVAGIAHWAKEPLFPMEAEGPLLDGLKGHFGWEPIAHIHRCSEEGLEALLLSVLEHGDVAHARELVQELEGLLAFMGDGQEWRVQALQRLWSRLAAGDAVQGAVNALHRAEPEAVLTTFLPYFEFLGQSAAGELVRILGEEPDRKRRGRLLEILRALGPLALSPLKESLSSPTWYLVRNTLNLLSDIGDAGMLEDVAQCLKHSDGRVRRAAVRALWKLGGPACAPHLLPLFPNTDPETQVEILFGLGQVQAGMAVFVLADFARNASANERLRIKTLETLGQIGNPAAIQPLAEVIRRKGRIFTTAEPTEVRLAAAKALVAIGTPEAIETLRKLIEEEPRSKDRDGLQQILDTRKGAPDRP